MGDSRLIREDARLLFRKAEEDEEDADDSEDWKDDDSEDSDVDLSEMDYAHVLKHLDNFLPVKELAGRPLDIEGVGDAASVGCFWKCSIVHRLPEREPEWINGAALIMGERGCFLPLKQSAGIPQRLCGLSDLCVRLAW